MSDLPDPIDVDYPCVACGVRADACCSNIDPACHCCIGCNHPYRVATYPEPSGVQPHSVFSADAALVGIHEVEPLAGPARSG
jgi:hypothetical protein